MGVSGFNDHRSFPFTQLRRHLGATEWAKREKGIDNAEELEAFAARKVSELDEYDEALEKREEDKALVDGESTFDGQGLAEISELSCLFV